MRRNKGRQVDGILLLDKPAGLSSNAALQKVKRYFNANKAGHTGSLDPLATGMLPICLGEATKFSRFLLEADKHYIVTAKLGEKTTSADAEGEVISTKDASGVTADDIEAVLPQFRGSISQVPSMFSALKKDGQPLYKLARQGIEVKRDARQITIQLLQFVSLENGYVSFDVKSSKGTYIRTLVDDIGDTLGCGAHVIKLRRLSVAAYDQAQMLTMQEIKELSEKNDWASLDAKLIPISSAVAHWPAVYLPEAAVFYLNQGQAVLSPKAPTEGWVQLFAKEGRFLGVGEVIDDGRIAPRRLVQRASNS